MPSSVLPHGFFTQAGDGLMFSLEVCPVCGHDMQARGAVPMGSNSPSKLLRLGLQEMMLAPRVQMRSPLHEQWVCSDCARVDPHAQPDSPPLEEPSEPAVPTVAPFVASEAVAVLEGVWRAIRARVPEVPEAVLVLASGTEDVRTPRFGHWAASRWRVDDVDTRRAEVLVAGEALAQGPRQVLSTLLHEAAHGLAHARRVQDTSRQGRYHNQRFRELAEELGLKVRRRDPHGHCDTRLEGLAATSWAAELAVLEQLCHRGARPPRPSRAMTRRASAAAAHRAGSVGSERTAGSLAAQGHQAAGASAPRTNGVRIALRCSCPKPRVIYVVPSVADIGDIACGVCTGPFLAREVQSTSERTP